MREKRLPSIASPSDVNVRLARAERDIRMLYRRVIVPRGYFEIKVWADVIKVGRTNGTGNGLFIFEIPEDLNAFHLTVARAYVTTAGSSVTTVQIRNIDNGNVDMLSTPITIDAGVRSSIFSTTQRVIDTDNDQVSDGDQIAIDVDTNPTDAAGLGVILDFE